MKGLTKRPAALALAFVLLLVLLPGSVLAAGSPGDISTVTAASDGGKITVSWTASDGAEQYVIQRRVRGSTVWTTLRSNVAGLCWEDPACESGVIYQYRVRGRSGDRFGSFRTSDYAWLDGVVPTVPAGISARRSEGRITLSWEMSYGATGYILQKRVTGSSVWTTLGANLTERSFVDADVIGGNTYQYRVRGRSGNTFSEEWASTLAKVPAPIPGTVASLTASAEAGKIILRWEPSSYAKVYILQRRTAGSKRWQCVDYTVTDTFYTDESASPGTIYQYRVRGKNLTGYGSATLSGAVMAFSGAIPGAVDEITAVAEEGKITLRWTAASGAAAYILQRREQGGSWTTLCSTVAGTSYEDAAGVAGTVYQYRVRGRNGTEYGPFSVSGVVRAAS
jgi:fibronectin type 3 domain-containing protein